MLMAIIVILTMPSRVINGHSRIDYTKLSMGQLNISSCKWLAINFSQIYRSRDKKLSG